MARPTKSIIYSVLVHVAIVALLVVGFSWVSYEPSNQPTAPEPIQATVVDADKVNAAAEKLRLQAKREAEARRQAEQERQQAIAEEKARLAALAEKRRKAEAEAQAKAEAKAEAERQAQIAAEKKRKAEAAAAAKAKAEAEAAAKAKAEAEAAERRRQERLAAERAAREAQLQAAMQAEERRTSAVQAGLLQQYKTSIAQKVSRNWIAPANVPPDLECEVLVTQAPGGIVLNVQITQCNGGPLVRDSIITATRKADPLPPPPPGGEFLFERQIKFIFRPPGN
ncbi:MAG TPA: cell envelope integrity protein TolA [Gammaproteobacteria bacterium]|nr:cell envelope integrity protein TolA [Gammaproteobacteria bacterium]